MLSSRSTARGSGTTQAGGSRKWAASGSGLNAPAKARLLPSGGKKETRLCGDWLWPDHSTDSARHPPLRGPRITQHAISCV